MDNIPRLLRKKWDSVRDDILVHYLADIDGLLKVVTKERDEGSETVNKRRETLKAVTQEHITSAIDNFKGNFGNYDYTINVDFGQVKTPLGYSKINSYYLSEGVEFILTRPNSFILVLPYVDNYLMPSMSEENIERKIELIEVYSEDIYYKTEEVIEFQNGKHKWRVDQNAIYVSLKNEDAISFGLEVTGSLDEYNWFLYSTHFFGKLPVVFNGGYSNSIRDKSTGSVVIHKYYSSVFTPVIPLMDDYLSAWSDMKMVNTYHSTPKAQVLETECDNCQGTGIDKEGNNCKKCKGTGKITSFLQSTGAYVTKPKLETGFNQNNNHYPTEDALKYITPPTGSLDHFLKLEQLKYKTLRKALFLEFEESATASGESRKENRKKAENTYKWISEMIFANLKKLLTIVQSYKIPQPDLRPEIIIKTPLDYSIKSESDLLESVKELPKSAPSILRKHILNEYLSKIYQTRPIDLRINQIMFNNDILYGADESTVTDFKLSYIEGSSDLDFIINFHYKGDNFLRQIENLIELSDEEVKQLIDNEFRSENTNLGR